MQHKEEEFDLPETKGVPGMTGYILHSQTFSHDAEHKPAAELSPKRNLLGLRKQ